MITFTENGIKLETWIDYITVPRQGEIVDLGGELKGVKGVLHSQEEITIMVE